LTRFAILVGLASEAAVVHAAARGAGHRLNVAVSGADAARAHWEAGHLTRSAPDLMVSFGLAGGLDAALTPSTLVVADAVVAPDGKRMLTDTGWTARLRDRIAGAAAGDILGADALVLSASEKEMLARVSGASAVDMESHALARAAHDAGIPFVALRAVCDPAGRPVPGTFLEMLDPEGRFRWRALPAVLRRPGPAFTLWRDSRAAHAALARAAAALLSV
jgi:nucleoside phosphorylase